MEEKPIKEKHFRLVLFSESTFEEVRSFHFRLWYLWAGILLVGILSAALVIGALSFEPIRSAIYESGRHLPPEELITLRGKINELEDRAQAQNLYIGNLRQLLSGEAIIDTSNIAISSLPDSVYKVDRIQEDETLRETFDLEEQLNLAPKGQSETTNHQSLEQLYLIPPVSGSVSMKFDAKKDHLGIDINAPQNTPIKSVLSGYIIYSGWTLETGNTVGIQHDHNIISFYKHNSALLKKTGSFVQAGEAVAIIGNTGTLSTGPHLHFELWVSGRPVDPTNYINF